MGEHLHISYMNTILKTFTLKALTNLNFVKNFFLNKTNLYFPLIEIHALSKH